MNKNNQEEVIEQKSGCCENDQFVQINVESGEHMYCFSIPKGTPVGHAYDAAFAVLNKIADIAKESVEKMKVQAKKEEMVEEDNVDKEQ